MHVGVPLPSGHAVMFAAYRLLLAAGSDANECNVHINVGLPLPTATAFMSAIHRRRIISDVDVPKIQRNHMRRPATALRHRGHAWHTHPPHNRSR